MSESPENDASATEERVSAARPAWWARVSPRSVLSSVGILVATSLLGAFVSDELFGSGLPRGTRAFGVDVSHWPPDRAARELEARVEGRMRAPLELEIEGKQAKLLPADAGLSIDVRGSLEQALRERSQRNVFSRFGAWSASVFGAPLAFLGLATVALGAFLTVLLAMPETAPTSGNGAVEPD